MNCKVNMFDMSGSVYAERISRLRKCMQRDNIDYYIVFTADDHCSEYIADYYKFRSYLSGFTGSAGTLVIGNSFAGLWTDGRYFIQAEEQLDNSVFELFKYGNDGVPSVEEYLSKEALSGTTIAFDGAMCSCEQFERLLNLSDKGILINNTIDYAKEIWIDRPQIIPSRTLVLDDDIAGKSVEEKIQEVKTYLADNGADMLILSDLSAIMWLFNIRGFDIKYSPVAYSYAVIRADKGPQLFAYETAAKNDKLRMSLRINNAFLYPYDEFYNNISLIKNKKIIIDKCSTNSKIYEILKQGNEIINQELRYYIKKHIKNHTEIELAKKYHIEDGLAVTRWIYEIKKRIKSGEVFDEFYAAKRMDSIRNMSEDFLEPSFSTICAYDTNGAVIHYEPNEIGSKVIENKGFLLLDSGGQYLGATTDVTRTIAVGDITDEMRKSYTYVLKGHLDLMNAVFQKGCTGENLDILARQALWSAHLDYKHGTSHGVGSMLSVHEMPPRVNYKVGKSSYKNVIELGMILSDEPGVYIQDKYGIRIENLLLCVPDEENEWGSFLKFDNLTFVPYEMDAVIVEMLTDEEKALLNFINGQIYELYKERITEEECYWLYNVTRPI